MAEKLLNKSTKSLLVFSVIVLLVSAPAAYFITRALYMEETDETLSLHKLEFQEAHPDFKVADVAPWNQHNRNVKIWPFDGRLSDTIYTTTYFDVHEKEQEPYREFKSPIAIEGKKYTYMERNNLVEKRDMVLGVALLFSVVILLFLIGVLLINKRTSKRLWKPFYVTLSEIEHFELDKSRRPHLPKTGTQEFDRLNRSVNLLIEKNQAIYATQKEFVENAAHELQTPLALFQGKIDTLLQTSLSKEQVQLLDALNLDVARLNRLNKNLLLLSKLENGDYPARQLVSIGELLQRNRDFFTEQANARNISVRIELAVPLHISANPALVEILLNNLFLNAIRHNVKDGEIRIATGTNSIAFSNTGSGRALNAHKLYNRFSQLGSSGQGNGLGLAIIKKIAELNGWEIRYSFLQNWHVFEVGFV